MAMSLALSTNVAQWDPTLMKTPAQPMHALVYDTLLRPGMAPLEQVGAMEAQAEKARAAGASLPPGFRAHLGMLKLAAGDADQARQLWLAEKAAFPESTPYMDQLLKRLDAPAKKDNPA